MTWSTIIVERREHLAVITLNRPERANTLNSTLLEELADIQNELAVDSTVRVVIVTGAGRHFCGGADLRAARSTESRPPGVGISLDVLPQPTIAAINGAAMGGGCEVALACDFRFISSTAKIGLPEIRFGALPLGGGTARLPRVVGLPRAKKLIMTGEPIDAIEAERIGLVDQISEPGMLMSDVEEFAQVLAKRAPYAVHTAKALLNRSIEVDLASALDFERRLIPNMATDEERRAAQNEAAAQMGTYANIFSKMDSK